MRHFATESGKSKGAVLYACGGEPGDCADFGGARGGYEPEYDGV